MRNRFVGAEVGGQIAWEFGISRCKLAEVGGQIAWEFGISRCKLLHTEWINHKVQLYSMGNILG